MNIKRLLKTDWEIIAGILAAVGVIILKLLHLVDAEVMLTLAVVLLAVLFMREVRREAVFDRFTENLNQIEASITELTVHYADQGSTLITPSTMNDSMRAFTQRAKGVCVFKHVSPFMFSKDSNFNAFLKPMLEHDTVSEVIFIINEDEKDDYNRYVKAKIDTCDGAAKVAEVIIAENPDGNGIIAFNCGLAEGFEALITFMSEPFMVKFNERWVPKFALHVLPDSEVAKQVSDNVRKYLAFR